MTNPSSESNFINPASRDERIEAFFNNKNLVSVVVNSAIIERNPEVLTGRVEIFLRPKRTLIQRCLSQCLSVAS